MSMLSAQVDELRNLATRYDELQVGAVKAVTMPSNMGSILREAADTIWELRDDLQRANAENAKLRELVQDFDKCLTEVVRLAYIQGHATIYDGTLLDSLHPRMRELGAEVDG